MKATNVRPPRKNGSARAHSGEATAVPVNGAARKRSPTRRKTADNPAVDSTAGPQELAGFAPANIQPVDAEMWPVQPVIWLQPEWRPALPASSGLRIERHHKIPAPGFLNVAPEKWGGPPARLVTPWSRSSEPPPPPDVRLTPPESGLTLLGWDPRTVVPVGQTFLSGGTTLAGPPVSPVKPVESRPPAGPFPAESKEK
jgi:hypothetical protein